ncbi:MAG: hypothetical protein ABH837_01065 [bacterium]
MAKKKLEKKIRKLRPKPDQPKAGPPRAGKTQKQLKPKKVEIQPISDVPKKRVVGFSIFVAVVMVLWGFGYSFKRVEPITVHEEFLTTVKLEQQNFPSLEKASYELWQVDRNHKISLGKFNINEQGQIIDLYNLVIEDSEFDLVLTDTDTDIIQGFQISIELNPDDNLDCSPTIIVSGKINQKKETELQYIINLEGTKGSFILSTPTDGSRYTNENAGIWFVYEVKNNQIPSLDLPVLPEGWVYESWIFYENNFISMGKFSDPGVADATAEFSGKKNSPTFPGEDFLHRPTTDYFLDLPLELNNGSTQVFISVEPDVDGSDPTGSNPFSIQFLNAKIKKDAEIHKAYDLDLDLNLIPEASIKLY